MLKQISILLHCTQKIFAIFASSWKGDTPSVLSFVNTPLLKSSTRLTNFLFLKVCLNLIWNNRSMNILCDCQAIFCSMQSFILVALCKWRWWVLLQIYLLVQAPTGFIGTCYTGHWIWHRLVREIFSSSPSYGELVSLLRGTTDRILEIMSSLGIFKFICMFFVKFVKWLNG